jgi:hypothetical protein
VCPVIEKIYALAGTHEAECFLAESRITLRRDNRPEIGTVARRLAIRSPIAISRWSLLVDRRASCDCADDLDVFDFLLVRVRILCQHDEVRQLARRDGSFDRLLMGVVRTVDAVEPQGFIYADSLVGPQVSPFQPVRVTIP